MSSSDSKKKINRQKDPNKNSRVKEEPKSSKKRKTVRYEYRLVFTPKRFVKAGHERAGR